MNHLDREGIFKARPVSWKVQTSKQSQSVGINVEFQILAQLVESVNPSGEKVSSWESWEGYDPVKCYGTFWVIGRTGQQNVKAIDQLVVSGLWNGDFNAILGPVPAIVVQITVNAEEFEGQTRYKASWVNPEDHTPGGGAGMSGGASADEVGKLQVRYGSLLRAAAAGAKKGVAKAAAGNGSKPSPAPAATTATATAKKPRREDMLAWCSNAEKWPVVQSEARGLGIHLNATSDLLGLDDATLERVHAAAFDADIPF